MTRFIEQVYRNENRSYYKVLYCNDTPRLSHIYKICFLQITVNYCSLILFVNCIYHCGTLTIQVCVVVINKRGSYISVRFIIICIFKNSKGPNVGLCTSHSWTFQSYVCFPITECSQRTMGMCRLFIPRRGTIPNTWWVDADTGSS